MDSPQITKCYGYIRVSTEDQRKNGCSPEIQEQQIRRYIEYRGYKLVDDKVHRQEKGVSGRSLKNRELLTDIINQLEKDNVLIIYSVTRLARRAKDSLDIYETIKQKGAYLASVKENIDSTGPAGTLMYQMLAILAEFESNQISERVSDSMKYIRENNRFNGKPPFGYKLSNGHQSDLIPDPDEQSIIQIIMRKIDETYTTKSGKEKNKNLNKIAKELNEEGIIPPKNSKIWYRTTLQIIVDNHMKGGPKNRKGKDKNITEVQKSDVEINTK